MTITYGISMHYQKFFIITIILLISGLSYADTEVEGDVSGVWDIDGSPYIVNDDITVQDGEELVIDPGVEVLFDGEYTFWVLGLLTAVGEEDDMITFTRTGGGSWRSIRLVRAHGSEISYCVIERSGIDYDPDNEQNPLTGGALYARSCEDLIITNNNIRNNFQTLYPEAICGRIISLEGGSGIIADNQLHNNRGGAIVWLWNTDASFTGNIIENNSETEGGLITTGALYIGSSSIISNNIIRNNQFVCSMYIESDNSSIYNNIIIDGEIFMMDADVENFDHNVVFNAMFVLWSDAHLSINNSIILGERLFLIREDCSVEAQYSLIQRGNDIDVGEGMINDNPRFVDWGEGDFHLRENSPCIDAGDPNSPEDPDGTRTDIGCYPFNQGVGRLEGHVFRASDNQPIEEATISTSQGFSTLSDDDGSWGFHRPRRVPFDLTASFEGYHDSTITDIQLGVDDTLNIPISLLHSTFIPSQEDFTAELELGDSTSFDFGIRNDGSGVLEWSVSTNMRDVPDPWTIRDTIAVGNIVDDQRIRGVVLIDDRYYVSGGGRVAVDDNFIYVLNLDGELLHSYPQLGQARYGLGDLAWDGELIWGGSDEIIYGFNVDGDSVTSFACPYDNNQAITWDSDRELLWITDKLADDIIGYDRDGNEIGRLDQLDRMIYGLAYFPDDPDGHPLYVSHNVVVPNASDYQSLHKIDPNENDAMFVAQLFSEDGDPGGKPEGVFITDQLDPYSWVMLSIANDGGDDRLDVWQVDGNGSWMRITPEFGTVDPDGQEEFTLTLDATDLTSQFYPGELVFIHNGLGRETRVSIDLTVDPNPRILIEPIALDFGNVEIGLDGSLSYRITNVGMFSLEISAQELIQEGENFSIEEGGGEFELEPREELITRIMFEPAEEREYEAVVRIGSNDPDAEQIDFHLTGVGVSPRDIHVDLEVLDFERIETGSMDSLALTIQNVGGALIQISDQQIAQDDSVFTLGVGSGAFQLEPDSTHVSWVIFSPLNEGDFQATLRIESDDPDEEYVNVILTGISSNVNVEKGVIPTEYAITGIYPNPFNSITTIRYALPKPQDAIIRLYDLSGREVATLYDDYQTAGYHTISIDAKGLASGVYWIRLTDGSQQIAKRVVLLR